MSATNVLELRIHGIANAPPAHALLAHDEEIVQHDGDTQGSFWRIKPEDAGAATMTPGGVSGDVLTTEAYSWGNQARSGGSALAVISRTLVHLGWLLVLPFGLCNLAYWARRDIKGEGETPQLWRSGQGAGLIRIFALLQTLFYTIGLLAVSVHMVALGCFPRHAAGAPVEVCAALPPFLDFLAGLTPAGRAALLAILPIAVILLLYAVSRRARSGFHPETSFDEDEPASPPADGRDAAEPPHPALLGSIGFWRRPRTAEATERTHIAAVFAFIVMILATDVMLDRSGVTLSAAWTRLPGVWSAAPFAAGMAAWSAGLVLLTVGLAWGGSLSGTRRDARVLRAVSFVAMLAAIVTYAVWLAWAVWIDRATDAATATIAVGGLSGMTVMPTVVAALGALIALASLSWGYAWPIRTMAGVLIAATLGFAVAAMLWGHDEGTQVLLSCIAAGLVIAAVAISYLPLFTAAGRERARYAGWRGNGAAVCLLVAWFSSLVITSLLVLGAHAWLSAATPQTSTRAHLRTVATPVADVPALESPVFYSRFATMLVAILVVLIVVATVALLNGLRRFPAFSLPGLAFPSDPTGEQLARQVEQDHYLGGVQEVLVPGTYPESEHHPTGRLREVANARRMSGLLHRGEPMLQLLAILTAASLLVLGIPTLGTMLGRIPVWEELSALSGWALGLLALAAVGWVVTNAVTSAERPLGLVWDIVCFFPRAGHPFTAPCYAERAVPELVKRTKQHIDDTLAVGGDPSVILSAHSMGGTIAVATIFRLGQLDEERARNAALRGEPEPMRYADRVALLTYGCQLRAYFSRFFPEVFGYRVLGTRGTRGPNLLTADPWQRQVIDEASAPRTGSGPETDPTTVVELLGGRLADDATWVAPRWRNLWRRTDLLGFPVFAHAATVGDGERGLRADRNPIDRGATERCPTSYLWKIARHDDYLSTAQYRAAREELVDALVASRVRNGGADARVLVPQMVDNVC